MVDKDVIIAEQQEQIQQLTEQVIDLQKLAGQSSAITFPPTRSSSAITIFRFSSALPIFLDAINATLNPSLPYPAIIPAKV